MGSGNEDTVKIRNDSEEIKCNGLSVWTQVENMCKLQEQNQ